MTDAEPLYPDDPRHLGDYEIVGRIGEGGMGRVYLGRDPGGRVVAVKVVRPDVAADPVFRARFRGEVERAKQVPSFCTAEVLDADPDHDPPYLVVEYVDGPSLADVVRDDGPLSAANLHGVAIGVAAALRAIHDAGVIHRDLKPGNVLLARGTPKVIDFGIARPSVDPVTHTRPGAVVGSVPYLAPERFFGDDRAQVSSAADIFAWGAVVTYAGTGRPPFHAGSLGEVMGRIVHDAPDLNGLTEPLRGLVEQALAKDPAGRPGAAELVDRLTAAGPPAADPSAVPVACPGSAGWSPSRLLMPALAAVAVLGVVTAFTPLGAKMLDLVAPGRQSTRTVTTPPVALLSARPSTSPSGSPLPPTPPSTAPPATAPPATSTAPPAPIRTDRPSPTGTAPPTRTAPASPVAPGNPTCDDLQYEVDGADSADNPTGLCMPVGGTIRFVNTGPGSLSERPAGRVACNYAAGIHNCRLTRPGTVTFTITETGTPRSFTLLILGPG